MNEYLSGKCAHCGERKEEHCGPFINCAPLYNKHGIYEGKTFLDSGEKLLHDRAPELLQAARETISTMEKGEVILGTNGFINTALELLQKRAALESIIGDILRPQP